jgi:DNA sulfur modification protein DndC
MGDKTQDRIAFVRAQFKKLPNKIYIGFSGGKDSSAVLKILYSALLHGPKDTAIEAIYCDTGVENPVVDAYVKSVIRKVNREAKADRIAFKCSIIEPQLDRGFFVRIIGRGYPPPTNTFRWCTTDIRIRPFQNFLKGAGTSIVIAVGTRRGESEQRDRSLRKATGPINLEEAFYQRQRDGFPGAVLFTPIIDFDVGDVWSALVDIEHPKSISAESLASLYRDGSGECPTVRDFKDKPCSRARFGCWTCTVVRKDRSSEKMIEQGHHTLEPFLAFRNWMVGMRNLPEYRCKKRRNGTVAPGPINLRGRREILEKIDILELQTGKKILSEAQRERIFQLWLADLDSEHYLSLE